MGWGWGWFCAWAKCTVCSSTENLRSQRPRKTSVIKTSVMWHPERRGGPHVFPSFSLTRAQSPNFHSSNMFISEFGFGFCVYRGVLSPGVKIRSVVHITLHKQWKWMSQERWHDSRQSTPEVCSGHSHALGSADPCVSSGCRP